MPVAMGTASGDGILVSIHLERAPHVLEPDRLAVSVRIPLDAIRALTHLMARMGHDSERAAMIYQHEARGADQAITSAIEAHVQAEQGESRDDHGSAGAVMPAS